MATVDHFVQFFEGDAQLVDAVCGFVERGVESTEVCVVIATAAHHREIAASLGRRAIDVAALDASYRYISIDADVMLSDCLSGHEIIREKFHERADQLLRQAASRGQPVRVFGELVSLIADRGLNSAVIELEEMWNELGRFHDFVLFCGYSYRAVMAQEEGRLYDRVCAVHEHPVGSRLH